MKVTRIQEITVVENFVDTNYLYSYALSISEELWNLRHDSHKFWDGRFVNALDMDVTANHVMDDQREKVKKLIKIRYNKHTIYSDICQIVRWPTGFKLTPHADAEHPDGRFNHYHYRQYASLIYLNDNYKGGETYFPNQNYVQKPKAGTLIVFPCTLKYLHGVKPITKGLRFTSPSWYTEDQKFNLDVRI